MPSHSSQRRNAPPPPEPAKTVAAAVYRIQKALLDSGGGESASSSIALLSLAGALFSAADYEDVVTERNIAGACGYPSCPHSLPSSDRRGRFRISRSEQRVYDLTESRKFCSSDCLAASRAFSAGLPAERQGDLSPAKFRAVLDLLADKCESVSTGELIVALDADELDLAKLEAVLVVLADSGGKGDLDGLELGFRGNSSKNLEIKVKDDAGTGEIPLREWIGPDNAIEGYVPQHDRQKGFRAEDRNNLVSPTGHSVHRKIGGDAAIDFADPAVSMQQSVEIITNDVKNMFSSEESTNKQQNATKSSNATKITKASKHDTGSTSRSKRRGVNFSGAVFLGDPSSSLSSTKSAIGLPCEKPVTNSKVDLVEGLHEEFEKAVTLQNSTSERPPLKSCLKTTSSISRRSSRKQADEKAEVPAKVDDSVRLSSAEACVAALSQAAMSVSSGKSEVENAVSDEGIIILPGMAPQPPVGRKDEEVNDEDKFQFEKGIIKWPKKTLLLDTDMFAVEDSWHDTPPEGFSLTLSPFATMWSAIFGWITNSSLEYIYGLDGKSLEELLITNGREYPTKKVLVDGQSSEIRIALDGYVCRSLEVLTSQLRLPSTVSYLQKTLAQFLDTMSFMEALPALNSRQWQVIVILFLDALSTHHLPHILPIMTNKVLLKKVLDGGKISDEEYASMVEILLPFGRSLNSSQVW